ncbi:hypothetical protein D9C73_005311 [Collichthys lucidus]|uniref:Uncharacterized protein n=1 Tax=Collichthys lucidus TaxID=240159 RepID=A0A4U5UAB4_COLLU|nr:hypothetical protein D9C73_005311 [Collichthys lucidus]
MCNQSHLLRIWSKSKNTTAYICIKGLTECSQVQVSINAFNGFAEESFGKTLTCYICSLIQFGKELQINYENTKTRLTTQQIHPSLCLFTGHTCSTVNTLNSLDAFKVGNLHTDVTVQQLLMWKQFNCYQRSTWNLQFHDLI